MKRISARLHLGTWKSARGSLNAFEPPRKNDREKAKASLAVSPVTPAGREKPSTKQACPSQVSSAFCCQQSA
jgi:hypothetical protein